MPDTVTPSMAFRLREVGSLLPRRLTNTWGSDLNRELQVLDAAIGSICTPDQIEALRRAVKSHTQQGVFL